MNAHRGLRAQRLPGGQALVEFALVLPVFVAMLFGVLDAGRFVYMNSVLSQAAREGARLAAVEASWIGSSDPACGTSGGPVCPSDGTALQADVLAATNRMVAPFGNISTLYLSCDPLGSAPTGAWTSGTACTTNSGATGNVVSVRVLLTFTPITPLIGQLIGTVTTSGSATMVIN